MSLGDAGFQCSKVAMLKEMIKESSFVWVQGVNVHKNSPLKYAYYKLFYFCVGIFIC